MEAFEAAAGAARATVRSSMQALKQLSNEQATQLGFRDAKLHQHLGTVESLCQKTLSETIRNEKR